MTQAQQTAVAEQAQQQQPAPQRQVVTASTAGSSTELITPLPQAEGWKPRYKFNAKQSAKGVWQMDVTVETYGAPGVQTHNPADEGDTTPASVVEVALNIIREAENRFIAEGRQMADPAPIRAVEAAPQLPEAAGA